jgi:hypothetical protein
MAFATTYKGYAMQRLDEVSVDFSKLVSKMDLENVDLKEEMLEVTKAISKDLDERLGTISRLG